MTVPTYSVIADNEIDPESPITTSLVTRLRNNPLAIFGIDPATPSPVFTLPPSTLTGTQIDLGFAVVDPNNGVITGTERIISVRGDDVEDLQVITGRIYRQSPWVLFAEVIYIEATYASGIPTGCIVETQQLSDNVAAIAPYAPTRTAIAADNAWYPLFVGAGAMSGFGLDGKCRYDATNVYLTLRWNYPSGQAQHSGTIIAERRNFKAKSA